MNFIIEAKSQSIDIDEITNETQMDDTLNLVMKALDQRIHRVYIPFQKFRKSSVCKKTFF